jgi:Fic family protein
MIVIQGSEPSPRGEFRELTWEANLSGYAPARYRRPCQYRVFVPAPLVGYGPALEANLAGIVSDAESRIHALNRAAEPALAPLARLLLRTESIASSKVEGMQVDARSLARAEIRHDAGARVGREALEVLGNVDAMQLAVEEASAPSDLRIEHIVNVHRALLEATNPRIAGAIREDQNWIGGNDYNPCDADFVPPPAEKIRALLEDLVVFCNSEELPPLVQAAIAHAQFETIHPFGDGNGRTGRALTQIVLRRRGLAPAYVPPISIVLAAERDRYIDGLAAFREGRVDKWMEMFAVSAARAADLASAYLIEVSALQERWRDNLRDYASPRADAAAWAVIDVLPAHPVITGAIGVAATGRSRPAVDQAIRQLADAGVLSPLSEAQRHRSWEASGLLDLLSGLENAKSWRPSS